MPVPISPKFSQAFQNGVKPGLRTESPIGLTAGDTTAFRQVLNLVARQHEADLSDAVRAVEEKYSQMFYRYRTKPEYIRPSENTTAAISSAITDCLESTADRCPSPDESLDNRLILASRKGVQEARTLEELPIRVSVVSVPPAPPELHDLTEMTNTPVADPSGCPVHMQPAEPVGQMPTQPIVGLRCTVASVSSWPSSSSVQLSESGPQIEEAETWPVRRAAQSIYTSDNRRSMSSFGSRRSSDRFVLAAKEIPKRHAQSMRALPCHYATTVQDDPTGSGDSTQIKPRRGEFSGPRLPGRPSSISRAGSFGAQLLDRKPSFCCASGEQIKKIRKKLNWLDTGETSVMVAEVMLKKFRELGICNLTLRTLKHVLYTMNVDSGVHIESTRTRGQRGADISFKVFSNALCSEEMPERLSHDADALTVFKEMKEVLLGLGQGEKEFTRAFDKLNNEDFDTRRNPLWEMFDTVMGVIIALNGISMGVAADNAWTIEGWDTPGLTTGWHFVEIIFTAFFLLEAVLKVWRTGPWVHFFGDDRAWNIFDACIVAVSLFEIIIGLAPEFIGGDQVDSSSLQLLKIVKLVRLTRLVKVFKIKLLRELGQMVKGFFAGLRTLFWALVLLLIAVYVTGVFLRQFLVPCDPEDRVCEDIYRYCDQTPDQMNKMTGARAARIAANLWNGSFASIPLPPPKRENGFQDNSTWFCNQSEWMEERHYFFSDVFRSMFVVFRCFMGDCSSSQGKPLPEFATSWFQLFYMFVIMGVVFGLFNLIMAIYIENTLAEAKNNEAKKRETQKKEANRIGRDTHMLVQMLCKAHHAWTTDRITYRMSLSDFAKTKTLAGEDSGEELDYDISITKEVFDVIVETPEIHRILDDLDVEPNREDLFDVLDANGNGVLEVTELVQGLLKVRGEARRSDVVASRLAVRALQGRLSTFESGTMATLDEIVKSLEHLMYESHVYEERAEGMP